ncbi:hypothetical protein EZV62_008532 [Acer yangbiense]|uniref:Wall-associated receptor kinase galacturonan-binding domain-containing protein n=1 Tax=Acer yangbiense TaxID=1000413 RepID=A0A5C7IDD0_9ROSI|nr:hypothetical protein EZV62_008532 [Acer yangbiense]
MSICCSIILLFLLSPSSESKSNYGVNNSTNITYEFCPPTTCGRKGPVIRFPFRLKTQPVLCGLEGFELSCSSNNNTLLHFPSFNSSTNDFYVEEISYLHSSIAITDPNETTCPAVKGRTASKLQHIISIKKDSRDVQARKLQQIQCSTSCGDIKNISYPFRLKGDPARCGDSYFELSCSQSNKTILEFYSGKYYVNNISYDDRIITVVDVNLANGSCGLPQKSLSFHKIYYDYRYGIEDYNHIQADFVRCSSKISDPTYIRLPCLNIGTQSYVYVNYNSFNDIMDDLQVSCSFISTIPIRKASADDNPSYETIQKLLQSGFDLKWSVACKDCRSADSYCYQDKCIKVDGKHRSADLRNLIIDTTTPSKFSVAFHLLPAGTPLLTPVLIVLVLSTCLLDIFRRNSFAKATRSSKAYFPSWVYDQMIKGGDLELRNVSEIEGVIARKLCIIGLWCIQMKATDRPSITKVVEMLEGSIDDLQMPPKPCFSSSSSSKQSSIREIQSDSSTELLESESIEECSYADTYDV